MRPGPDPDLRLERERRQDGLGCGSCRYLGFGPALATRCLHPGRACFLGLAEWVLGCPERRWIGELLVASDHPAKVDLGPHCEALFLRRASSGP